MSCRQDPNKPSFSRNNTSQPGFAAQHRTHNQQYCTHQTVNTTHTAVGLHRPTDPQCAHCCKHRHINQPADLSHSVRSTSVNQHTHHWVHVSTHQDCPTRHKQNTLACMSSVSEAIHTQFAQSPGLPSMLTQPGTSPGQPRQLSTYIPVHNAHSIPHACRVYAHAAVYNAPAHKPALSLCVHIHTHTQHMREHAGPDT